MKLDVREGNVPNVDGLPDGFSLAFKDDSASFDGTRPVNGILGRPVRKVLHDFRTVAKSKNDPVD